MNLEAYVIVFQSMQLDDNVEYFSDGMQLIEHVTEQLACGEGHVPITMMLLDYQMPEANGEEVVKETKALYQDYLRANKNSAIREPQYVMLSAHVGKTI